MGIFFALVHPDLANQKRFGLDVVRVFQNDLPKLVSEVAGAFFVFGYVFVVQSQQGLDVLLLAILLFRADRFLPWSAPPERSPLPGRHC